MEGTHRLQPRSRPRPINFRGYDEWLNVSLLSQGVLEFPYANRPLNLIWSLPAWALFPDRLVGFLVRDVIAHTRQPLERVERLEVTPERRVHPGAASTCHRDP